MNSNGTKLGRLLTGIFLAFALVSGIVSEAAAQDATPAATVKQFKQKLDANDLAGACKLMAEPDRSGPLTLKHYEQTQLSLDGLGKMWLGADFSISDEQINADAVPQNATVTMTLMHPNQNVRFTLLKFGPTWYIVDIEIYFR